MFDIGWTELLVIGIVALIVIGPKDLPGMFHALGVFMAKARRMARDFSSAMEDAAKESGVGDVAKDLKNLSSTRSLGLDKVQEAATKFDKWDPLAKTETKKGPATQALSEERAADARKIQKAAAKKATERLEREATEKAAAAGTGAAPKTGTGGKQKTASKARAASTAKATAKKPAAAKAAKPATSPKAATAAKKTTAPKSARKSAPKPASKKAPAKAPTTAKAKTTRTTAKKAAE